MRHAIWLSASLLTLAGCSRENSATSVTDAPVKPLPTVVAVQQQTAPLPGLPGLAGLNTRKAPTGHEAPVPKNIKDLLLSLPSADLKVPRPLLQSILEQANAYIVEIPRVAGHSDMRMTLSSHPRFPYFVWVRSFQGDTPGTIGYLVQVSVNCGELKRLPTDAQTADARTTCAEPDMERLDSGLHAYRVEAGKAPEDMSTNLTRPEAALGAELYQRYQHHGGSTLFLDDSRLDRVPVARWVMEFDPEHPLATDSAHAFDHGAQAHAGFLVWNGDHFESHDTVPAALWPCPPEAPSLCTDDDRFVTGLR
jgi:hypothetical protein